VQGNPRRTDGKRAARFTNRLENQDLEEKKTGFTQASTRRVLAVWLVKASRDIVGKG